LGRLEAILVEPATNDYIVDATIQRFEFVIELFWKTLKRLLALEQIETMTPKEALQRAYQARWLQDENAWLAMVRARNRSSHVYDEAMARQIDAEIRRYFPELRRTYDFLVDRFGRSSDDELSGEA
jgi:nucleotidyltransferase substrate binding protein (TIGR01987 family)